MQNITPENIQQILEQKTKESLLLKVKTISQIEFIEPDYLIADLLIRSSVGFISASPGSTKTWLSWDMALSIATGTKCCQVFQAKKGKVLAFNAEDSPGAITKARLSALASYKGIKIDEVQDLQIIDESIVMIDNPATQERIRRTIDHYKPDALLLDPFRQIHAQNEDKASDMAPLLGFLRELQRDYGTTVLLVCHERKGSVNDESGRREDRTRGSNALEGWRDTAIYLDRKKDKKTKVQVYHRGHMAPEPFFFNLDVENKSGQMVSAVLSFTSVKSLEDEEFINLCEIVFNAVKFNGYENATSIAKDFKKRKAEVLRATKTLKEKGMFDKNCLKLAVPVCFEGGFDRNAVWEPSGTVPF